MKIHMANGSPRKEGSTYLVRTEIAQTLAQEGIDSEIVWVGAKAVTGCTGTWPAGSRAESAL